jgi:ribosome modulation factor
MNHSLAGYLAAQNGVRPEACPYPANSEEAAAWLRGNRRAWAEQEERVGRFMGRRQEGGEMKRTGIKRSTQPSLKRTTRLRPVSKASVNWKRQAAAERLEFMAEHLRCMICGLSIFARPSRAFHCHHLMGRGSRKHECRENWLFSCDRDHRHYHDGGEEGDDGKRLPELTPGHLLWCKEQADGLDADLLASLKGWKALPDHWQPTPLPDAFIKERICNS